VFAFLIIFLFFAKTSFFGILESRKKRFFSTPFKQTLKRLYISLLCKKEIKKRKLPTLFLFFFFHAIEKNLPVVCMRVGENGFV